MVRMASEAEAQIEAFSQQNLANLAWAYGKLSHYESVLMDAVAQQAAFKVKVQDPNSYSFLVTSLGNVLL